MKISDIQELFSYIKGLHQNTPVEKRPKLTPNIARAWCDALDGYTLEEAKAAALRHSRRTRFWPALDEIVKELPKKISTQTHGDDQVEELRKRWFELRAKRQEQGLPETAGKAGGMGYRQLWDTWDLAGLNL